MTSTTLQGKPAGILPSADGRISFLMELKDGTIVLRSADGSDHVTVQSAANRFVLSLIRMADQAERPSPGYWFGLPSFPQH